MPCITSTYPPASPVLRGAGWGLPRVHTGRESKIKKDRNEYLTYEDVAEILKSRGKRPESISEQELDDINGGKYGKEDQEEKDKEEASYQKTAENTRVPIHGNCKEEAKDDEAIRILSVNVNIMSYWLNNNHKAERLKYVYGQYGIGAASLQEVCTNWAALPTSKTIAQILRIKAKDIRSVASHNKREGKEENIGKSQRGGTSTILREGLTTYVVDSGTDEKDLGRWSWYKAEGEK